MRIVDGAVKKKALVNIVVDLERLRKEAADLGEGMLAYLIATAGREAKARLVPFAFRKK
jgi:hypothetical protein